MTTTELPYTQRDEHMLLDVQENKYPKLKLFLFLLIKTYINIKF